MIDTEPHNAGPAPLTLDNWYEMNHHDWKDVVNEYNYLLAEVKRLREGIQQIIEYNEGVDADMFGSQVSDKLKELIE